MRRMLKSFNQLPNMITGQHWRPPFPSSPSLLHAYQKNSEEPAQVVCQFTVINLMMHIRHQLCKHNLFERLPVSKLCSLMSNLFTRHNRPSCIRGNVAMLCGPFQGWRDFHPRRSTSDFHSNQRVQLRGRKNFLVSVRVINLGYHIMHIHKYSPEYLGYLIGMVRLEVIPLVAGVCAGYSRTYSHCQSESKV